MPYFGSYQPPSSSDGPPFPSYQRDDDEPARLKAAVRATDVIEGATPVRFRHNGDHADATCPWCQKPTDRERKFRVFAGGGFKCVKCSRSGGDVISFLQEWNGYDFRDALDELRRVVGGEAPAIDRARIAADRARSRAKEEAERTRKQANARGLWERATPDLPQEAVAYLRDERGLPNHAGLPLRFLADCPFNGATVPCILAPVTDGAGSVAGLHRIGFARPAGEKVPRKMLGAVGGCAVRIARGHAKAAADVLVLAEGVETSAAVVAMWGFETWACLSAGNLSGQEIPAHVRLLRIVADHDLPNEEFTGEGGTGWALARKAAVTYAARGVAVEVWTTPEPGTDLNDELLGRAGQSYLLDAYAPATVLAPAAPVDPHAGEDAAPIPEEAPGTPAEVVAKDVEAFLEPTPGPVAPIALPAFARPTEGNEAALARVEHDLRAIVREAVRYAAGGPEMEGVEPPRTLVNVTIGAGKSESYIKILAEAARPGGGGGDVLIAVPNIALADELKARLEAAIRQGDERRRDESDGRSPILLSPVNVRVWRGRTKERPGEPKGGERMCARPKELVERVQKSGARVDKTLCFGCPFADGCRYLAQGGAVREGEGRNILIMSHEHLFLPMPRGFKPRLVVVDEGLGDRMTGQRLVRPEILTDDSMWTRRPAPAADEEEEEERAKRRVRDGVTLDADGNETFEEGPALARTVADALHAHQGAELARLRSILQQPPAATVLRRAARFLRRRTAALRARIEMSDARGLDAALAAAESARFDDVAGLFEGLAVELGFDRPGANGNRSETRRFKVTEGDDDESAEWVDEERFVSRRIRKWRVNDGAAVVWVDATANRDLVERFVRKPVAYVEHVVPLRGTVLQVDSVTNSKYRLTGRKEAPNSLARMAGLVRDLYTLSGASLFVCATQAVEKELRREIGKDCPGIINMHFGIERGSDAAKACRIGLVIGREEPGLAAVEDAARCFAVEREETFVPAPAGRGGRPDLVPATRKRTMRDESNVEVGVSTHPDPLGRAVLEQVRESSVIQALGRLRMAREPGKLGIVATSVPVPVEVDGLVSQHALEQAATLAAGAVADVELRGVHVVDPKRLGAQPVRLEPFVGLAAGLLTAGGISCRSDKRPLISSARNSEAYEARIPLPSRGRPGRAWLLSPLPPVEAFAAARAAGHDVLPVVPFAPARTIDSVLPVEPDFMDPNVWELPTVEDLDDDKIRGAGEYARTPIFALPYRFRPPGMDPAELVEAGYVPVARGGIFRDTYHWPTFEAAG